MTKLPL